MDMENLYIAICEFWVFVPQDKIHMHFSYKY